MKRTVLVLALVAAGFASAHEVESSKERGRDIEHVNKGIHVESRDVVGDVSTVNGGVTLEDGAEAQDAETVNGGIRLGVGARARSVETVNGGIRLDANAQVSGDAEAVNGGIQLGNLATVQGRLENVNGAISLDHARVGGGIKTVNGDVLIGNGSVVEVGLKVEKPSGWFNWGTSKPPRIVIGADAVVNGPLVFERDVELFVHERAKIGAVTGATAKRYNSDKPPL